MSVNSRVRVTVSVCCYTFVMSCLVYQAKQIRLFASCSKNKIVFFALNIYWSIFTKKLLEDEAQSFCTTTCGMIAFENYQDQ